jgi:hypothetical protein
MSQLRVSSVTDLSGAGSTYAPGHVVQVVSATKTDAFSTTSTSYTNVTGLSATITPKFASSKIYVSATVNGNGTPGATMMFMRLTRAGTAILVGDTAGSRNRSGQSGISADTAATYAYIVSGLDSPSSTSNLTYTVQVHGSSSTVFVNRSSNDSDSNQIPRTVSSITVMEIAQ